MDNLHLLSPECVIARYSGQRIPQYQGNPLIEALPPSLDDEALIEALTLAPVFDPGQRNWDAQDRLQMLGTLSGFMVPLQRHVELARALDAMLRTGYVGRAPRTAEHARVFQAIYEKQKAGTAFRQTPTTLSSQLSASLIGLSGMGKTSTVKRWLSHMPKVIYHPELHTYQIPYLHVEMPSDGSSIKGLAHGILQKIDQLIPGANYYEDYAIKGRPGADTLMRSVARVMHMHSVGLLIADEVQNLANARKGAQTVMTELVSAANTLGVPILFIGTNKAAKVLSLDFRQARRSSGLGITPWDRLAEHVDTGTSDWEDFLEVLWNYQWTRKPVPLNGHLASVMYTFSQGVIDIAIKLFASTQARAMADGSEQITAESIALVYQQELKLLHPMVDALRNEDIEALANFDDIAPIGLEDILEGIHRKLRSKAGAVFKVKPGDSTFKPRVAAGLVALGFDEESAIAAAETAESSGTASNTAEGARQAMAALTEPRRPSRSKKAKEPVPADFTNRPHDYRRAVQEARLAGTSVLDKLRELGMATDLGAVLKLH